MTYGTFLIFITLATIVIVGAYCLGRVDSTLKWQMRLTKVKIGRWTCSETTGAKYFQIKVGENEWERL